MNKLSIGFVALTLTLGGLLGGCAMPADDGETDDESVASVEGAEKRAPTRAQRVAACKADCAAQYTPCKGGGISVYSVKDVKSACNPNIPPELGGNPYGLAICNEGCDKL